MSSSAGCADGGCAAAAGTSSSLRMRRIEARMSSIEGSLPGGPGGGVCDALIVLVSSARLVGRVLAEAHPLLLRRVVVGGLVIQRYGQMQIARGQPPDRRGHGVRRDHDLCEVLHES